MRPRTRRVERTARMSPVVPPELFGHLCQAVRIARMKGITQREMIHQLIRAWRDEIEEENRPSATYGGPED